MKHYKHEGEKDRAPWWHRRNEIRRVKITSDVRGIGNGAFSECDALESVSFPEQSQMNAIGEYAFYTCVSLKTVEIPKGVWRIEQL